MMMIQRVVAIAVRNSLGWLLPEQIIGLRLPCDGKETREHWRFADDPKKPAALGGVGFGTDHLVKELTR
jgi:hypothetical protein